MPIPYIMQRCHQPQNRPRPVPEFEGFPVKLEPECFTLPKARPAKRAPAPVAIKRTQIAHPYARLFAKKDEVKRRKIWNHALEKSIFDANQL